MTDTLVAVETLVYISTHTLTWSVTIVANVIYTVVEISTHTLTWSVTVTPCNKRQKNSKISTHTLTWSVTKDIRAPER